MELDKAKELLPKFMKLKGETSPYYDDKKIVDVFVGFEDVNTTINMLQPVARNVDRFPKLSSDKGHYTIVVLFEDGTLVSAKSIVDQDNHPDLIQDAEQLSYTSGVQSVPAPIPSSSSQNEPVQE